MGEVLYRFTSCALCFQFNDTFVTHFSPHQFRVVTKSNCETIIHGIKCTLDLHFNWVVFQLDVAKRLYLVWRRVIFQKLRVASGNIIQLIPFVHAFYAFESPMFYSHHNCESDVIVIPSAMGTHQGDPLGRALFTLAHFKALHSTINYFLSCLFPSIVDDIHIIGPLSIVSFAHEHFQIKLLW